jgi:hypothetical protein
MYEPPSERWKHFGSHMHRFEPPDLYVFRSMRFRSRPSMASPAYLFNPSVWDEVIHVPLTPRYLRSLLCTAGSLFGGFPSRFDA